MRRTPGPRTHTAPGTAYGAALILVAARELSTVQLRERLRRRQFAADAIDAAIDRLRQSGTLDDRRVARARARTEAIVKHRGPARVLRQLQAIGIDHEVARETVREVFAETDESTLVQEALTRRLGRSNRQLSDPAERRRLAGHLIRLGFSPRAVSDVIRRHARTVRRAGDCGQEDDQEP